jgi:hypothetical protein
MSDIPMKEPSTIARWSVGGTFLEALATRDYERMASTLGPTIRFRALLPPGPMEWEGPARVADAFSSWFGGADDFELVHATVGEIGGRLYLAWRIRVRPAPFGIGETWHVIEQHGYANAADSIETLDLLCSGFHPECTGPQRNLSRTHPNGAQECSLRAHESTASKVRPSALSSLGRAGGRR